MEHFTSFIQLNCLDDFIGQEHIVGRESPLYNLIQQKDIPHLFFYGQPGTGKTSLAKLIAKVVQTTFYNFNATTLKIEDLRKVFIKHANTLVKPIVFIDEVHRLNKNQQEVLLPIMETYQATIIGASTENPYYTLTNAIRSRSFQYEFFPHTKQHLQVFLKKIKDKMNNLEISLEAENFLINSSSGDARSMLNLLEYAYKVKNKIDLDLLQKLRKEKMRNGISSQDTHYDLASAMIKSIRGSDVDASLYYLAQLIHAGEEITFITRRLIISASEDIGNANPNALNLAVSTHQGAIQIGYPEARILLGQCVIYLASSPKSNSSYLAINKALMQMEDDIVLKIPPHIKDKSKGYLYPHDFGGWVQQTYTERPLNLYTSSQIGFEKTLNEWLNKIKGV